MNARHILFKTPRFTVGKENPIIPCYFGDDLSKWLRSKLADLRISSREPIQADWAWYLELEYGTDSYVIGIRPNAKEDSTRVKENQWRVTVEKDRTFWQTLTNKGRIAGDDPIVARIEWILRQERDFRDVRNEPEAHPQ